MHEIKTMSGMWNQVEKFDGKGNFSVWQCVVTDVLVQQGLIDALEGTKPESTTAEDWKVMERKAVSTIRLCLSDEVKYSVIKENSPKKLWKSLEELYMAKSLTNRWVLKRQLFRLRMEEGTRFVDHLNVFNKLVTQLVSVDEEIEENDKVVILASSLPPSWEQLVMNILVGKTTLNFNETVAYLLEAESLKKPQESSSSGDQALTVSSGAGKVLNRGKKKGKSKGSRTCYLCDKEGHMIKDCPNLKNMRGACSVASEDEGDILIVSQPGTIHDWILDSGSCFHVCSAREMFDEGSQRPANGIVHLADCKEYAVTKVGTVTLEMHNGTHCTLTGVRYIPGLKKNLISVRSLELQGCGLSLRGGVMRVTCKGQVIMKSIWINGGYRVIGNLNGGATIGRFGKNPDQEKEAVSSTAGTQISVAVKCKAAKVVAKSNSRRGEAASCWKKEDVVGPTTTQYRRAGGAQRRYKPMAWRVIGEGGVVNQTTQRRSSQVEGPGAPAGTLTRISW